MKPTLTCPHCGAILELRLVGINDHVMKEWRNIPIKDMELSVRSETCLRSLGLKTAGEVADKSDSELLSIPAFGRKHLNEVRECLAYWRGKEP